MELDFHGLCWLREWKPDAYLGNGAVINLDQVTRGRVDLETLVKGKSGLNGLGCCMTVSLEK